jgi:hypothetical protein
MIHTIFCIIGSRDLGRYEATGRKRIDGADISRKLEIWERIEGAI